MRYLTLFLLFLFVSVVSFPKISNVMKPANDKIPTLNQSVVRVNDGCSGAIVSPSLVVTAAHCISNPKVALVQLYDNSKSIYKVIYIGTPDTPFDFAILKGDTKNLPALPLSSRVPGYLEKLIHYGYNGHPTQFETPAMFLQYMCHGEVCEYYMVCKVIPGDSGGPMVSDITGEMVGIAYASYWPTNVALAVMVPSKIIIDKLNELSLSGLLEEDDSHTDRKNESL